MRELAQEELIALHVARRCPFCEGTTFFEGPHGGMSENWFCASTKCGAGFALTPGMPEFGQLIRDKGEGVSIAVQKMLEGAEDAIAGLEANPEMLKTNKPLRNLLINLREARDRYLGGARPLFS